MRELARTINGLARSLVPESWRMRRRLARCRAEVADWISRADLSDPEAMLIADYLKRGTWNNLCIPYPFAEKYNSSSVSILHDRSNGLHYVLHDGRRLYFPQTWSACRIRTAYTDLLIEQDVESPHHYEGGECRVQDGEVVLDVGAAEGIFALSVIDRARRVVVVEGSEEWFAPLEATFAPFGEKVRIVRQYISDRHDPDHAQISLDAIDREERVTFVKADIEGCECKMLQGGCEWLAKIGGKLAICVYHRQDDLLEIMKVLQGNGWDAAPSAGYMLYYGEDHGRLTLRKGVVRGGKRA